MNKLLLTVLTFTLILFNSFSIFSAPKNKETYEYLDLFGQVFDRVRSSYVDDVSDQELIEKIPNNTSICGEAAFDIYSDSIATEKQIKILPSTQPTRKCIDIYNLGNKKLCDNLVDNPLTLEPIYLRSSQIANANKNLH